MGSVNQQFYAFFITVTGGFMVGALLDLYRIIRGLTRPNKFFTNLGDLIFPIISGGILYIFLLLRNYGEVRAYVFLGISLGFYIYRWLLSPFVIRSFVVLKNCIRQLSGKFKLIVIKLFIL